MPPRRSRLAQAREPSSATIEWLSDDLLAKCFASLSQKDRLCNAALVCRRWCEITTQPEMLRMVAFKAKEHPATTLTAARLLLLWMLRHGRHVRSVTVKMGNPGEMNGDENAEMMSLLDNCMTFCSSRMVRLGVFMEGWREFTVGGWVATATSLEQLAIQGMQTLRTWATLTPMTSLRSLQVGARDWHLSDAVVLPASLTSLRIIRHNAEIMPQQVAALTNLRCLCLCGVNYSAASMASLTRSTLLRRAQFDSCQLPASLSQLTGLQLLQISNLRGEPAAASASIESTLRQLTQLIGLFLLAPPAGFTSPPSLTTLRHLQWLWLYPSCAPGIQPFVLPPGPLQRSLRHLATTIEVAQRSLPFLSGAGQLRHLSFMKPLAIQPTSVQQWQALWRWMQQHASLQRVDFDAEEELNKEVMEAMKQLQAQRPALRIDTRTTWRSLYEEMVAEFED